MSAGVGHNKPVVLLLENYILDSIGQLPQADDLTTQVLVEKAFGEKKDWRGRLKEEFGFTDEGPRQLKAMWKQAQAAASQAGASLSPREFAHMVVEENFQDTVEMVTASFGV